MSPIFVRPARPDDLPVVKAWLETQRDATPFDADLARRALLLIAYDESGPLGCFPAWPALVAGCPLEKEGLSELRRAEMAKAVVQQLAFIAAERGAPEVAASVSDDGTERLLTRLGFAAAGKYMRRRDD